MTKPYVAFCVPWRDKGDAARAENFEVVYAYLRDLGIGPVVVASDGRVGDEPFNRSAAYNLASASVDADVYVFTEADLLVPGEQLQQAIRMACGSPGLVVPFSVYRYLSIEETRRVRAGSVSAWDACVERYMGNRRSVGACNVVSRHTLTEVGQWDETFDGWGYDDRAMDRAFAVTSGQPTRFIDGPAVHLWHVPGWEADGRFAGGTPDLPPHERDATRRNADRYQRYKQARTAAQIRALTQGSP